MEIDLIHDRNDPNSTGWRLAIDGRFECYALGLPLQFEGVANVHNKTCIPYGRYPVSIVKPLNLDYLCPHILEVPNRDSILLHVANYPHEILGCFAVGQGRAEDAVMQSQLAFDVLFPKIQAALDAKQEVFINVKPAEAF